MNREIGDHDCPFRPSNSEQRCLGAPSWASSLEILIHGLVGPATFPAQLFNMYLEPSNSTPMYWHLRLHSIISELTKRNANGPREDDSAVCDKG